MITCVIRYQINPKKYTEFKTYAEMWIALVHRFGGEHHGYFLPGEGANTIALALFSFPSLASYERYRLLSFKDESSQNAYKYAEETECIVSYERSFFTPVFS